MEEKKAGYFSEYTDGQTLPHKVLLCLRIVKIIENQIAF
jgi:hypothetical protein